VDLQRTNKIKSFVHIFEVKYPPMSYKGSITATICLTFKEIPFHIGIHK